jgi:hypothetical protein
MSVGTGLAFTTDLVGGLEHLELAIKCFESQRHGSHRFQVGVNSGIASYASAGLLSWLRGFPDRALEYLHRAVTHATEMRHPYSMAYALFHAGFLHVLRQEPEAMRARGVGALDVAEEYELPIWRAVGTVLLGAAKTDLGRFDEGLAEISSGVEQYQGLHSPPVFWPLLLFVRARACARAGRTAEGLRFIDESLAIAGEAGPLAALFLPMKGELLGSEGAEWFRRAFDTSADAGVRSPQLRAAAGLYRVEPTDEHMELLRSTQATFTEGFETPDLIAARELLQAGAEDSGG